MTENEIIKALECLMHDNCEDCPYYRDDCADRIKDPIELSKYALDLINRKQAENDDLLYKLTGVMHSVDKWLDGDELKQDEVNQAATMREKTLQIVEKQQAEIDELKHEQEVLIEDIHYSADRINQQLEEIERLKKKIEELSEVLSDSIRTRYKEVQSEAIKEFAEELKEKLELCDTVVGSDDFGVTIEVGYEMEDVNETIDNLVKEMIGENK